MLLGLEVWGFDLGIGFIDVRFRIRSTSVESTRGTGVEGKEMGDDTLSLPAVGLDL